jgi:death-on-curing protein
LTRQSSGTRRRSVASRTSRKATTRRRQPIVYLDEVEIAYVIYTLAEKVFERVGGMPPFELDRSGVALLESAINAPRQPYYRTVHDKAACLFRSLCKNHPLKDGNKRLAVTALQVFLNVNNVDFKVPAEGMIEAAVTLASHEGNYPLAEIARWIRAGCRGRPRKLTRQLAESWEIDRAAILMTTREQDVRVGRRARIPGRRVRLSTTQRELLGITTPSRRLVFQGGPRDGDQIEFPARLSIPVTGSEIVTPDPTELLPPNTPPSKRTHLVYEVTDHRRTGRKIAAFKGRRVGP